MENSNLYQSSIITKVVTLAIFVITFLFLITLYTYIYARVQNSTIFFKFLDVIRMPSLSQILSVVWLISLPILLVIYYLLFFSFFKRSK